MSVVEGDYEDLKRYNLELLTKTPSPEPSRTAQEPSQTAPESISEEPPEEGAGATEQDESSDAGSESKPEPAQNTEDESSGNS